MSLTVGLCPTISKTHFSEYARTPSSEFCLFREHFFASCAVGLVLSILLRVSVVD